MRNGHLYGAATTGGTFGSGVVFELTPQGSWRVAFQDDLFLQGPTGREFSLWRAAFRCSGNIYGTTYYGGANGVGAVYKLLRQPVGEWNENVLYSFQEGSDGNSPISNLVFDGIGNLYGTTSEGGLGRGTIFKLSPWRRSVDRDCSSCLRGPSGWRVFL